MVLTLAPRADRVRSQNEIGWQVNGMVSSIPGIRGAGNGLQVATVGNSQGAMGRVAATLVEQLEADDHFTQAHLFYETTRPQLSISIDRARVFDLGIAIDGLAQAIQAQLNGTELGNTFTEGPACPACRSCDAGTVVERHSRLRPILQEGVPV